MPPFSKQFLAMFVVWAVFMGTAVYGAENQKPFHYDAEGKRDPFVPLILNNRLAVDSGPDNAQSLGKPELHGILWDAAGHSIALIDNLEAKTGDTVQGYKVMAIRKDAVVLEANGQSVVLEIAFEAQPSSAPKGGDRP